MGPDHRARPAVLAVIAAGGFLGAAGRYEVGLRWPTEPGHFPATTFGVNTTGAFALALLLTLLLDHWPATRLLRPFACTGLIGAWTTMSTLALESDRLVSGDRVGVALAYVGASLAAGVAAAWAGVVLAEAVVQRLPDGAAR